MIQVTLQGLPPSSNNAYFHRGRKRILTTTGRKYKNEVVAALSQDFRKEMMIFKKNASYMFFFVFFSTDLYNKNFKEGGKLNRYKKFDGGNLTKLLEDCFSEAGGFDDSQTMTSIWQKKHGDADRTRIYVWNLEEEGDPFDHDYILSAL